MADAYFSDDSSFYGDEEDVKNLERRAKRTDLSKYWDRHDKDINAIATRATAPPELPKGDMWNRYEGVESAWQLHETIDDFVKRVPVRGGHVFGHWIWVANPYEKRSKRRAVDPEEKSDHFMNTAPDVLDAYMAKRREVEEQNPNAVAGTITRKLKFDREKLKQDLLALAKKTNMTCGKWMLFPKEDDAPAIWRKVVEGVIANKLGIAAKIASDSDDSTRLICMYTKDFSDEKDVMRVLSGIEKLGLLPEGPRGIYYKCDAYTYLGITSKNDYGLQASLYGSKDLLAGK